MHLVYCSLLSLGYEVNKSRMSQPEMGSIIHMNNLWNILVIGKYYVNYQNYQNKMPLSPSDTRRTLMQSILVYKFRRERTGFNMYAENTRPQLTFLALVPCIELYSILNTAHTQRLLFNEFFQHHTFLYLMYRKLLLKYEEIYRK